MNCETCVWKTSYVSENIGSFFCKYPMYDYAIFTNGRN